MAMRHGSILLALIFFYSFMMSVSNAFSVGVRRIGTKSLRLRSQLPTGGQGASIPFATGSCGCAGLDTATGRRTSPYSLRLLSASVHEASRDDPDATVSRTESTTTAPQQRNLSTVSPPATAAAQSQRPRTAATRINANTGGLRRLPVVRGPTELANRAVRVANYVKPDTAQRNGKLRAHKHGAMRLHSLTNELCGPLRDVIQGYNRELRRLHPFETVVADLTVRARQQKDGVTLSGVLSEMDEARKMILQAGKEWTAKVKQTATAREAGLALDEAVAALVALFEELAAPPVTQLMELQKGLRHAPVIQLDTPAIVLVGAPNVGKSSIVRAISSASPEVNNYPFTTRGMTLGHVEVFWSSSGSDNGEDDGTTHAAKAVVPDPRRRPGSQSKQKLMAGDDDQSQSSSQYSFSQLCQVMDSPGLLVRPDELKRNEMEQLTIAAMQHLPTAVCYVMDLSGQAGDKCSSVADQLTLRRQIRARFPRRPWIDVVSKVDLGFEDDGAALRELREILDQEEHASPCVELSIHEETGVNELRTEILRMLGEVRVVLDAMAAVQMEQQRQQAEAKQVEQQRLQQGK